MPTWQGPQGLMVSVRGALCPRCPADLTRCIFSFSPLSLSVSLGGFGVISLFSLQMPAPPKLFLTLLYKLEGLHPDELTVSLEITTWDSETCLEGNVTSLPGENPAPPSMLSAVSTHCRAWDHLSPSPPALTLLLLAEPNSRHHPRFLPAPPPGLAKLLAACGSGSNGWTSR